MTRARIPPTGRAGDALLAEMQASRGSDADYKGGRTWSLVYWAGDEHHDVVRAAHDLFLAENALNPMAFPSLKRMEAEVVRMTCTLFHGDAQTCGTMTSGGTESLLLAVKTASRVLHGWLAVPGLDMLPVAGLT